MMLFIVQVLAFYWKITEMKNMLSCSWLLDYAKLFVMDAHHGDGGHSLQEERMSGKNLWCSTELFGDRSIIQIEHSGCVYTLRITKENRLLLTK